MNAACAYCARPLAPMTGEHVGPVKFCGRGCIVEWFSLPAHDRRHDMRAVAWDRRAG